LASEKDSGLLDKLSQDQYKQFDAEITPEPTKLYFGKSQVGGSTLKVNLQEGRSAIDPMQLDLPGALSC